MDLRARREAAGVTLETAAGSLGVHRITLSRLERAHTVPNRATVSHLLHLYGAPKEEAEAVLRALAEAKEPGWWHPWRDVLPEHLAGVIDLESAAELIRVYSPGVIPELLQTPGYARALLQLHHPRATGEEVDRRLRLLRERQERTLRRPVRPVRLWALIEDVVLQRPVGGPSAMTEQMNFLDHYTRHRGSGITVQVIPTAVGGHPLLLSGSVSILRYSHPLLADRLIARGLHPEAATVTEDFGAVHTYLVAMDETAALAPPPTTPLPTPF
ncbi:Scr1 family TA system antitoxin-like transcriptional regulator [Streptomyces sp. NPDC058155]|uniref:Scr1 family TA system antitoxin-like transcriptional regulator n=1 Tax=Streptomyces sp. NPDC058155 TaxID=3346359 RepID=UPI0036EE72FC